MTDDMRAEFDILGNILILLALDAGGSISMPRKRWQEIDLVVARREYDEETDTDTITIISNKDIEVLM